jgi:hypothetical protein
VAAQISGELSLLGLLNGGECLCEDRFLVVHGGESLGAVDAFVHFKRGPIKGRCVDLGQKPGQVIIIEIPPPLYGVC